MKLVFGAGNRHILNAAIYFTLRIIEIGQFVLIASSIYIA